MLMGCMYILVDMLTSLIIQLVMMEAEYIQQRVYLFLSKESIFWEILR